MGDDTNDLIYYSVGLVLSALVVAPEPSRFARPLPCCAWAPPSYIAEGGMGSGASYHPRCRTSLVAIRRAGNVRDSGCDDFERQEKGGQAGVPSRDGAGSATVRRA